MTPYTPEQRADLAKLIEARAKRLWVEADACHHAKDPAGDRRYRTEAEVLEDLAREIRDGSFFEVHHD